MVERLANEILDASNGLGAAVQRREDTHKMARSEPGLRATTAGDTNARRQCSRPGVTTTATKQAKEWEFSRGTGRADDLTKVRNIGNHGAHRRRQERQTTERILYYTVSATRSVRCTTAPRPWTGWSRSRSGVSPSTSAAHHLLLERQPDQHHRHPGTRRLHRLGGAQPARARRCRLPSSTARRVSSRSPSRSGARPTSTTSLASARQQDGQGRCGLYFSVKTMEDRLGANVIPIQLPVGSEGGLRGRRRPGRR